MLDLQNENPPLDLDSSGPEWGQAALDSVDSVSTHQSKASQTYYKKVLIQYLSGLWRSVERMGTVLRPGGFGVLVVQGSQYKNVLLDLGEMMSQMLENVNCPVTARIEFPVRSTYRSINARARAYGNNLVRSEQVIIFKRALSH